jgi:hypothetical protein
VTWVMWNLTSFCLETVLVSVQDRCIVLCPMVLRDDEAQVKARFVSEKC